MIVKEKIVVAIVVMCLGILFTNIWQQELFIIISVIALFSIPAITSNKQLLSVIMPVGIAVFIVLFVFYVLPNKSPEKYLHSEISKEEQILHNYQDKLSAAQKDQPFFTWNDTQEVRELRGKVREHEENILKLKRDLDEVDR